MPKGYFFVEVEIADPAAYEAYRTKVPDIISAQGTSLLGGFRSAGRRDANDRQSPHVSRCRNRGGQDLTYVSFHAKSH
jgi:hypothetical protein